MAELGSYRAKRRFAATPEPKGRKGRRKGHAFVVQKHDATRLHYDFRLELDGVLKSWAVTKGPSLDPADKRLAVAVEDHPLDYADFEGTIPKGEYGGGAVIVWDRGTWTPEGDPHEGLRSGRLDFTLEGEKLGGRWHLVRMARKPRDKRDNWLLIKGNDAAADPAADILGDRPDSVKTGRRIAEVAGEPPGWSSKTGRIAPAVAAVPGARAAALPAFVEPQLATLAAKPPKGGRWIHEIKFDGYRLQARIEGRKARLLTRGGLDWTARFGKAVPAALAALPLRDALVDGELVVETASGASDFSALQADLSEGRADRFVYYAFDLLHLDGHDLRDLPLERRKALLGDLIPAEGPLRLSADFADSGEMVLRHACRLSLEGVVSKRADAPYRSGRGKTWVKSKCTARQEAVVAGFVPSTVLKNAVGALAMGVYDNRRLRHIGRVGTGFSHAVARQLFERLEPLAIPESPFDGPLDAAARRGLRFVRPELVAEVEFRGWTGDGNLRHASFRGLREDKSADTVVRETAAAAKPPPPQARTVALTHPDRLYWPDAGVTKAGLADYYAEVWPRIAPFVVGRPLALLRAPSGVGGQTFFQKHPWKGVNRRILQVPDPAEPDAEPMLAVDGLDGLLALVQSGVLEIHPWGSTLADWERPDTLILDLDPGDGVAWEAVIAAAREIRARLADAGLAAFVKTSGGKGLHVVSPLRPAADWPTAKAFAKGLADAMAADSPDAYVATIAKAKRRGKILVDYLRNQRGATAVAPYSTRARAGAPVSMPLAWEELSADLGPAYFTVANAPARLAALDADPWADFRAQAAPLEVGKKRR